eukprot:Opistho-1_new@45452
MASRDLVRRLNRVDLPTLGRPTSATTGFIRCRRSVCVTGVSPQGRPKVKRGPRGGLGAARSVRSWGLHSFGTEAEHAAIAGDDDQHASGQHRRGGNAGAVGGQAVDGGAVVARQQVNQARAVTDRHRTAHGQRRGQAAVLQAFVGPGTFAIAAAPGQHMAIGLCAKQVAGVAADAFKTIRGLGPQHTAAFGVDTAHAGLESACADHVVQAGDTAHQVHQALYVVDAAGGGQRGFPPHRTAVGVEPGQPARQANHQGVAHRQYHTGLAQHQGLARTLLLPQLAAGLAIEGIHRTVGGQHKHTATGHQWRGEHLGLQLLAPELPAAFQHHHVVRLGHHGREFAVAADAGGQRGTHAGAPALGAGGGVQHRHAAVAAGHGHAVAIDHRLQWATDGADACGPGLCHRHAGRIGTQRGWLRFLAAKQAATTGQTECNHYRNNS